MLISCLLGCIYTFTITTTKITTIMITICNNNYTRLYLISARKYFKFTQRHTISLCLMYCIIHVKLERKIQNSLKLFWTYVTKPFA